MTDTLAASATGIKTGSFLVAALYHFARFDRYESVREPLQALCEENGVKGTLLLAREGINGTIAGPDAGIETCWLICAHSRSLQLSNTRKAAPPRCPSCA